MSSRPTRILAASFVLGAGLVLGVLAGAAVAGPSETDSSSLEAVRSRGKLIMLCFPHQESSFVRVNTERGPMKHAGTAEDFEGKSAAVLPGSSQEEKLRRLGFDDDRLRFQEFTLENYDAVIEGRADFVLLDSDSAYSFLERTTALKVAFTLPDSDEHYGYALLPGSDLKAPLDAYLDALESSGELARIKARRVQQVFTSNP